MRVHTYQCEICGAQKKEANHWMIVALDVMHAVPGAARVIGVRVRREWCDVVAALDDVKHVCGEEHVLQLVSRFLQTGALEAPHARRVTSSISTEKGREA